MPADLEPACSPHSLLQRWRLAKEERIAISPLEGEMPGRAEGGAVPPTSRKFMRCCAIKSH
ncbi:MAG: hypothetical protein E5Y73_17795 [Mesorhizobium sp.]|nr:MAG: hypothetical protein E5Y73_17795 [Mesorhizobium sp.]TIM43790.1 MAG: hypothetical protein E5Y56_17535 [Mesorhizobium sp.]